MEGMEQVKWCVITHTIYYLFFQGVKLLMNEIPRTCLWCSNPCDYYFKTVAPKCHEMLGEEATQYRVNTACCCGDYKEAKHGP